jgi:hypothetical protein
MKNEKSTEIKVVKLEEGSADVCVVGTSPLLFNSMSAKALRDLLAPKPKKNKAEKESTLKHDPFEEFRSSIYQFDDPKSQTLLALPAPAFKSALSDVALDMPGDARKAQIARLTWVEGYIVPVWGVPLICCAGVRLQDMARTPDVRTRAVCLQWASRFTIRYATNMLKETTLANLLVGAGRLRGVGDFRPQKGKGSFGQFKIVSPKDPEFVALQKFGRKAQEVAMREPEPWDGLAPTAELLRYFADEKQRRGFNDKAA